MLYEHLDKPTKLIWKSVYVNWSDRCYSKRKRGICITGVGDLPNIVRRLELFVNKFHEDNEPLALDCIRAWIDHKEICPVSYNYDPYKYVARLGVNKTNVKTWCTISDFSVNSKRLGKIYALGNCFVLYILYDTWIEA